MMTGMVGKLPCPFPHISSLAFRGWKVSSAVPFGHYQTAYTCHVLAPLLHGDTDGSEELLISVRTLHMKQEDP